MISLLFGLGDKSPKYFPEEDFTVLIEEDSVSCIVVDDFIFCELTEDVLDITLED